MWAMILRASWCALRLATVLALLPGLAAAQEMTTLDVLSGSIDCRPLCGSKFCCVAGEIQVPICVAELKVEANEDIGPQCSALSPLTGSEDVANPEASLIPKCKIGCCDPLPTAAILKNPAMFARAMNALPSTVQALLREDRQQLLALSDPSPEGLRTFMSGVTARLAEEGHCVFCCKWDF